MAPRQDKAQRVPLLEWIAAGIGLLLTLFVLAVIGRQVVTGEIAEPPAIELRAESVRPLPSGFVVSVVAINRSGGTGAGVEVEGELKDGETSVETSGFTLDYVPGYAERRGGLFFKADPRKHRLELRALGYQRP